jgi:hypothetical protein
VVIANSCEEKLLLLVVLLTLVSGELERTDLGKVEFEIEFVVEVEGENLKVVVEVD